MLKDEMKLVKTEIQLLNEMKSMNKEKKSMAADIRIKRENRKEIFSEKKQKDMKIKRASG